MTIKFNISEEDYVNFNIDHFHKIKPMKGSEFLLRFLLPLAMFILCVLMNVEHLILLIVILYAIIWIGFFQKFMRRARKSSTLNFIRKGKANDFIGNQSVTLEDDAIEITNAVSLSKIKYQAVEDIYYSSNLYYIYVGAIKAVLVPYSAFSGEKQRQEFFDILYKKTGVMIKII